MDKIVSIIKQILLQLGANQTAFIQIAFFILAITFLTIFVFNPYFKAADQRFKRTKGADAVAKDAAQEAKNLASVYQTKAREINNKIKDVFDLEKTKALKQSADILSQAKTQADTVATQSRKNIEEQLKQADTEIEKISQDIATTLQEKFEKGL
ncbi:MAG: ATP synthase F0 subunit B [Pseudobdellovibrio sp.]